MSFESIDPMRANELMRGAPEHVYLDVRSVDEFNEGHADGAINIPIAHLSGGGMTPNPDFLRVASAVLAKETPLVVGCKMGGRSARACQALAQAGFTRLHNIDGGFEGRPDAESEPIQKGWLGCALPVSTTSPTIKAYDHFLSQAGE